MEPKPTNDGQSAVTKFCLALEELRRTEGARVKTSKELVESFFPHDATNARDQLFVYMPREVRAPIVAGWGIRGAKAALRDDDDRIRMVVHDAILAGDIDDASFEEGVTAKVIIDWVPLDEWWSFWRSGKVAGAPAQKALAIARELKLFDDRWFLENVDGRGGRLKGTDTICDTLSKDQVISWVRNIHASGDGTAAGIVAALGWDAILAKTSQEALLFALDALAKKVGLVKIQPAVRGSEVPGIAIPDFPMEERNLGGDGVPVAGDSWPELAAPGDMGYAKPAYGGDDHDDITSEHRLPTSPAAAQPSTPEAKE